jgi:methionine-rich copper-binding protein CopC
MAIIAAGAPLPAQAHAFLDHALPKVGSTVQQAPDAVHIWFTQNLEPAFSTIEVRDEAGNRVDKGDPAVQSGDEMAVALKPLPAGKYKVMWHVLSVDTHESTGTFTFTIVPQ